MTVEDGDRKVVLLPLPVVDEAACGVRVKKTTARNKNGKLFVKIKLKGRDKAQQEVRVKIVSRTHEPVFGLLGTTSRVGKARKTFSLPSGIYDVRVDSLNPQVGGECLDPYRNKQKLVAKNVVLAGDM